MAQKISIAGFQVSFPYQPYGTQLAFMNQFLRAVDQQGNALLEAPTGSGKTACLLAAALSWQRRHIEAAAAAKARNLTRAVNRARRAGGASAHGGNKDGAKAAAQEPGGDGAEPSSAATADATATEDVDEPDVDDGDDEDEDVPRVPKVYYATRTHSQIAQVIRELKRMGYGNTRMAVLVRL